MLFAVRPDSFNVFHGTDFELDFAPKKGTKVEVLVFVRRFEGGNSYKCFVGKAPLKDAIMACHLSDDFAKRFDGADAETTSVYRNDLALCWSNRSRYELKYDYGRELAIVLLAGFKEKVAISANAMKRKPRYFGGFGLVELRSGEQLRMDGRYLIYDGSTLRMSFDFEIEEGCLVDCTSVLNRGSILAPSITLF